MGAFEELMLSDRNLQSEVVRAMLEVKWRQEISLTLKSKGIRVRLDIVIWCMSKSIDISISSKEAQS
jgi:hypothetical protein